MPIDELKQVTMTEVVNNIDSPNQFLKRLLFSRHRSLPTETIEIDVVSRGREVAPFVRKNGEGIMVGARTAKGHSVEAPNIRIKRPLTSSELLYNREPGGVIYNPTAAQVANRVQRQIADDLQDMGDMITNAEEWLCALAIQGTISYEVEDQEVFTITLPRPSANTIVLTTFWNDADKTKPRPLQNILAAKKVVADDGSPALTDAICGASAADAILELAESDNLPAFKRDSGISAGDITFASQFSDDGVIFLGTMGGIRFWSYPRTVSLNGSSVAMIRDKYVEFVSRSPAADRVLYYAAIPDMTALRGRRFVGERFSKSWEVQDPSVYMALVHSRPLPVTRRLGAHVSMKVISG